MNAQEQINKLVGAVNELKKVMENRSVFSVNFNDDLVEVHLKSKFFEDFAKGKEVSVIKHPSDDRFPFPYEMQFYHEGIKFIALFEEEEYKKMNSLQ